MSIESSQAGASQNILDILLDENNHDAIVLVDENGRQIAFEQVAILNHVVDGEENAYVILKPIDKVDGIKDDEAVAFVLIEEDGKIMLRVEENEKTVIEVFNKFYDMLEEERKRRGGQ